MNDYLELALSDDDDVTTDLWVHFRDADRSVVVLKDISTVTRYQGFWTVGYSMASVAATAHIPSQDVLYLSTVERPKKS